jgi:hypothetical protein
VVPEAASGDTRTKEVASGEQRLEVMGPEMARRVAGGGLAGRVLGRGVEEGTRFGRRLALVPLAGRPREEKKRTCMLDKYKFCTSMPFVFYKVILVSIVPLQRYHTFLFFVVSSFTRFSYYFLLLDGQVLYK